MRILALDLGSRRIGVAISDPLGLTAQGLTTIECKGLRSDLDKIAQLVTEYRVDEIVVGMPYNMNGSEGPEVEKVRALVAELVQVVAVPVREWDERLSTVAAERMLIEADLSRNKRRKVIDKVAAIIILQGFLDNRRNEVLFPS